jgi:hypothetical protein
MKMKKICWALPPDFSSNDFMHKSSPVAIDYATARLIPENGEAIVILLQNLQQTTIH